MNYTVINKETGKPYLYFVSFRLMTFFLACMRRPVVYPEMQYNTDIYKNARHPAALSDINR